MLDNRNYCVCHAGGGVLLLKSYVDVLAKRQKFDFLCTNFSLKYPFISIPFFDRKSTQFCPSWVQFTIICSKLTQFFNFGCFVSDENQPIAISNFVKKYLKRQAHTQGHKRKVFQRGKIIFLDFFMM